MDSLRILLGPETERFLARVWPNAQEYVTAAGVRERFPAFFDRDELGTVDSFLRSMRGVLMAQDRDARGEIAVEKLADVDSAGAVLRFGIPVQAHQIGRAFPEVRDLEEGLLRDLGLATEGGILNTAFVSPAGRGLCRHFDDKDVFVVGILGTKVFYLAPNDAVRFPDWIATDAHIENRATVNGAPDMPPGTARVEVGPGDCLFIPRGMWHETASGDASVSMSIGVTRPTMLDLVLRALRESVAGEATLREPYGGSLGGEGHVGRVAERVLDALRRSLGDFDGASVERHIEGRRARAAYTVRAGYALRLAGDIAEVLDPEGDATAELELDASLRPVVQYVSQQTSPVSVVELARAFPSTSRGVLLNVLESLHESGFLARV